MKESQKKGLFASLGIMAGVYLGMCTSDTVQVIPGGTNEPQIRRMIADEEVRGQIQRSPAPLEDTKRNTSLEVILEGSWGLNNHIAVIQNGGSNKYEKDSSKEKVLFEDLLPFDYSVFVQGTNGYGVGRVEVIADRLNQSRVKIRPYRSLSIIVEDESNHNPLVGANVAIENIWARPIRFEGVTSRQGILRVNTVEADLGVMPKGFSAPGQYFVSVDREGYTSEVCYTEISGNVLTIELDQEKVFEFKVLPEWLNNPSFELYQRGSNKPFEWDIEKSPDNKYSIRGLPTSSQGFGLIGSDKYFIKVSSESFPDNVFSFTSKDTGEPEVFRVMDTGALSGRFIDEHTRALPNTSYRILFESGGKVGNLEEEYSSDNLGTFEHRGLGQGTYKILAGKEGYESTSDIITIRDSRNSNTKSILLRKER